MKNFFKTVAIVTVFSICEKFLGFLYRIFLSHTIGAEGIGMYQVSLSVFALLLTITCSGTPITVSRLMTKYKAENKHLAVSQVITAGLTVTLLVAVPLCLIFFLFRAPLDIIFADERCMNIFLVVLPGLIFTSIYSVIRGVFWGNKDFLPYSVIELLEEICMIVVGIVLISNATSIYSGTYRAGIAVLISYIFSFLIATAVFFIRKNKLSNPCPQFKPLLASAVPITAMRTTNSFAVSLVSVILPLRLVAAGFSNTQAMSMFGAAVGQAIPLLYIPTTLISSFILVLVPEIAESYYKNRHQKLKADTEKALKFTVFITCLFIPVFFVCGEEIGILIFGNHECGKYLSASSFLMLFMSLSSLSTSILNSVGLETKTLVFFIISGALMLLSIWFLPQFIGIYSLLVGFMFVFGLTSILNLRLLNKNCKEKPKYLKFIVYSILFIIPTSILGLMLEKLLLGVLGTLLTFFVCASVLMLFNALLYFVFGLIKIDVIKSKLSSILPKKNKKIKA